MTDSSRPLHHHDPENASDETLASEARAHLAKHAPLQLVAELVEKLRAMGAAWWKPELTRSLWPAHSRMRWLAQRSDVRQRITTALTGLPANTARKRGLEFQADLIDSVIDDGDIDAAQFEDAFDPCDFVVYGPAIEVWSQFRDRMPWEEDSPAHQKLVAWAIRQLMSDRSTFEGITRRPILPAWDVRSAIDTRLWQAKMPLEIRVAVDEARLRHEKSRPREPFHARHELAIAVPEQIAMNLPLSELTLIFAAAERSMGVDIAAATSGHADSSIVIRSGVDTPAPPSSEHRTIVTAPLPMPIDSDGPAAVPQISLQRLLRRAG